MQTPLSCIPTKRDEQWWLRRHLDKIIEKSEGTQPFDIIFIGDSIVHACEAEGEAAWRTHFGHLRTLNLGYAGDRTEHVLWRIENGEVDEIKAGFVVLLIGTNNAGHRHDKPQEIAQGIQQIIGAIRAKIPQCKIILTAIFPRSRNKHKRMRKAVDATNQIIQTFANERSTVWFNINPDFLNDEGILYESVMPDLLHPNAVQYEIWAKKLAKLLRSL